MKALFNVTLLVILIAFLSNNASATSLDKNDEKVPVQAFFAPEEVPTIGNIPFEHLLLLQMIQRLQPRETIATNLEIYYATMPPIPFAGGGY